METITKTIYLMVTMSGYSEEPHVYVSDWNMPTDPSHVELAAQEITFTLPPQRAVTHALVGGLEKKVLDMEGAAGAAIAEVRGQIQSLLALEHIDETV